MYVFLKLFLTRPVHKGKVSIDFDLFTKLDKKS